MTNDELLGLLNSETKSYLDDAFSFLDFLLLNNKDEDKIDECFAIAFLISSVKNDNDLSDIFEKNGLTIDKIVNYFDSLNINVDEIDYLESEKTGYVRNNELLNFFSNIAGRLSYNNYMEEADISLNELKPYQIFDFILEEYYGPLVEFCEKLGIDLDDELVKDICSRVYDCDSDFAAAHGINLEEEEEKELTPITCYDMGKCLITVEDDGTYIEFDSDIDFEQAVLSGAFTDKETNNRTTRRDSVINLLEKNRRYKIKKLSGYITLDKEHLDKILDNSRLNEQFTIILEDSREKNISFILSLDGSKTFEERVLEEDKKTTKMSDLRKDKKEPGKLSTPYLDKYGFDLTTDKYLKDPSVGRDEKMKELEIILLYPEKDKSIIVTGTAGCGKTALVKGLAYRIQKGDVPNALKNLKIIGISCAALVEGTKYVGTLEEKMRNILEEASSSKDIVIFLDEIHQALGAGKSEGNDNSVSEILKPYLDYGRARVIGATTTEEYNEYVASDAAFKTRFKRVKIDEPDNEIIYQIVDDLIESYNKFSDSKLLLPEEEREMVINWLLEATRDNHRVYNDKASNPRLILDIIKYAYANAALNDRTEVSYEDIKEALLREERLNKSAREEAVKRLGYMKPQKRNTDNVIQFRLTKK